MASSISAIRFSDEERELVQNYAELQGISFSQAVRDSVMEQIENFFDLRSYQEYMAAEKHDIVSWEQAEALLDGHS
jgi:hypothetical protein